MRRVGGLGALHFLVDLRDHVCQVEDVHGGDVSGVSSVRLNIRLSLMESCHQRVEVLREPVSQLRQSIYNLAYLTLQVSRVNLNN